MSGEDICVDLAFLDSGATTFHKIDQTAVGSLLRGPIIQVENATDVQLFVQVGQTWTSLVIDDDNFLNVPHRTISYFERHPILIIHDSIAYLNIVLIVLLFHWICLVEEASSIIF